jgi:hypothetical protein
VFAVAEDVILIQKLPGLQTSVQVLKLMSTKLLMDV